MQLNHSKKFEATGVRLRDRALAVLIGMLLVGLIGLSISIRTQQVRRALKGPSQTATTMTKSDLPAPPLPDFELMPQPFARLVTPRPPSATMIIAPAISVETSCTHTLWHSVSAQHRPPPDFPA
jgi:hypothetical protein